MLSAILLQKVACKLAAEGPHRISKAVSMRCSQALDRLFCSSKAVSAVRFTAERTCSNCFTGDRTSANCETPENEEESRTRQGLERRHRRTSKQRHSKENHGKCLEGLLTEMTAVTLDCCCGVFVTIGQAT